MAEPPVSRLDAGVVVGRLVDDLSDSLLALEQQFFHRAETLMVGQVDLSRKLAQSVSGDWARALGIDNLPLNLAYLQADAMALTMPSAKTFFEAAAELALDSIQIELRTCELSSSVPSAHEGIESSLAVKAVETARLATPFDVDVAHAAFDQGRLSQRAYSEEAFKKVLLVARHNDEDEAAVMARLFSADPVRLPGQSGAGVWWSCLTYLRRNARGAEILMVNRLRKRAMVLFNRYLAE
jgi:hypothetical protein